MFGKQTKTAAMSECIYSVRFSECYLSCVVNVEVRGKRTVNSALLLLESHGNGMIRKTLGVQPSLWIQILHISEACPSIIPIKQPYCRQLHFSLANPGKYG